MCHLSEDSVEDHRFTRRDIPVRHAATQRTPRSNRCFCCKQCSHLIYFVVVLLSGMQNFRPCRPCRSECQQLRDPAEFVASVTSHTAGEASADLFCVSPTPRPTTCVNSESRPGAVRASMNRIFRVTAPPRCTAHRFVFCCFDVPLSGRCVFLAARFVENGGLDTVHAHFVYQLACASSASTEGLTPHTFTNTLPAHSQPGTIARTCRPAPSSHTPIAMITRSTSPKIENVVSL